MEEINPNNPDRKTLVLCFDGTGNKFEGKDTDSNILKIYRLLDRTAPNQFSWYNPGIGTYVRSSAIEHTGIVSRTKSWYSKMKDEAVGSSLAEHVMSGYRFLMRYYSSEDDIYLFGFSRGAYTARFLAEMLDHIGLLSAGNEELQRFAWKTFSKWQARPGVKTEEDEKTTMELYHFMKGFRETFSRPIRRVRFLGLFDTVNSVPRFENAWMQRTKYPYTAKSSAKVIRHAVSIGERRAKFRVDLISGNRADEEKEERVVHHDAFDPPNMMKTDADHESEKQKLSKLTEPSHVPLTDPTTREKHQTVPSQRHDPLKHTHSGLPSTLPHIHPYITHSTENLHPSPFQNHRRKFLRRRFSDVRRNQDILEIWFSGNHSDIGGGWPKHHTETWPLSHAPLVWMVQEAQKAGLVFDSEKLVDLHCSPDKIDDYGNKDIGHERKFSDALHQSSVSGFMHDCLERRKGLKALSVISWNIMEHLPFRRMDLQPDGSWKPIRWPLPKGEVRDVPADAKVHVSVLKRMQGDDEYRPGNLISLGEGGRGERVAPKEKGMGKWVEWDDEGAHNIQKGEILVGKVWAEKQNLGKKAGKAPGTDKNADTKPEKVLKEEGDVPDGWDKSG